MKKFLKRTGLSLLSLLLLSLIVYCWLFFPILSGWVAKATCSAVFVSSRNPDHLKHEDFSFWLFSLPHAEINYQDSSVTASIFGLAKRKAIYRTGLGATLISGITEEELRKQSPVLAPPPMTSDSLLWPQGDRLADTTVTGIDTAQLNRAVHAAFFDSAGEAYGTRALVVVYHGQIVAEKYAPGFTAQMPQLGWSMAKSIVNALLGIMVRQKKLDIHAPVPIAAWQHDERRRITYAQLMQMTSGQRFQWFPLGPGDLTYMLFKEKDMSALAANLPLKHPPGTVFHYSDANAILLSRLIRDRLGDSVYYRFPYEQLFYKIGMRHTVLEPDAGGTFVGCSYCYATARDWARFGLLYLHDGVWNGERILPEGWVRWTASPSGIHNYENFEGEYGALWWVNAAGRADAPGWRFLPSVPADCFSCQGLDGQYVFVIPSRNLVVVQLSLNRSGQPHPNLTLNNLLKALPK